MRFVSKKRWFGWLFCHNSNMVIPGGLTMVASLIMSSSVFHSRSCTHMIWTVFLCEILLCSRTFAWV